MTSKPEEKYGAMNPRHHPTAAGPTGPAAVITSGANRAQVQ